MGCFGFVWWGWVVWGSWVGGWELVVWFLVWDWFCGQVVGVVGRQCVGQFLVGGYGGGVGSVWGDVVFVGGIVRLEFEFCGYGECLGFVVWEEGEVCGVD